MCVSLDENKWRGVTEEDDDKMVYALNNYEGLDIDSRGRVNTHRGVYLANARLRKEGEQTLAELRKAAKK